MTVTETELAEIRERLSRATPGPWSWRNTGNQDPELMGDGRRYLVMSFQRRGMQGAQPYFRDSNDLMQPTATANLYDFPDADLIAHAPSDLAGLIDEVDRLQRVLSRISEIRDDHRRIVRPGQYTSELALIELIDGALQHSGDPS